MSFRVVLVKILLVLEVFETKLAFENCGFPKRLFEHLLVLAQGLVLQFAVGSQIDNLLAVFPDLGL